MINISNETMTDIIKATFLLTLSISGNFLAETLGCQSQKWLQNMYVKHILILFMIYFTINFTQKKNTMVNPLINFVKAIVVWILFHLFTHMDILPTFFVIVLLMTVFVLSNYTIYLTEKMDRVSDEYKRNYIKQINTIKLIQEGAFIGSILIILLGFMLYYLEKHKEYKKRFSLLKFIFGVKKCKNI